MSVAGKDKVSSNDDASEPVERPEMDDGAFDASLSVAMMRVQDCRLEGRAFGTKTSIILSADGVLLAIIASTFSTLEPWTAVLSIGAIVLSAYKSISVLRINMDVFELDALWEDTLCQNLDDGKFTKLFLTHKLVRQKPRTKARLRT